MLLKKVSIMFLIWVNIEDQKQMLNLSNNVQKDFFQIKDLIFQNLIK